MTTITDMVDEVRMLELELQKLELNRKITQVKADILGIECGGTEMYDLKETISDLLHNDMQLNMFLKEYEETVNNRDKIIECLKAELSSRGEDSKVLMDVVGIVKAWDERSGQAFPTMYELCDLLVDYIDVPELPIIEDDSSDAEDYHVVIKVGFLGE